MNLRFCGFGQHSTLDAGCEVGKYSGWCAFVNSGVLMSTNFAAAVPIKSSLRVLLVVLLGILSLVPLMIVDGVADERRRYSDQAQRAVADSWGLPQELTGPVLMVPVDYSPVTPANGWKGDREAALARAQVSRKHVLLLPDKLEVDAAVDYEMRERGIYQVALFSADVAIGGAFRKPRQRIEQHVTSLGGPAGDIDWSGAKLVLGVSDPRAIRLGENTAGANKAQSVPSVTWGEVAGSLEPGTLESIIGTSVQVPVAVGELPETEEATTFALKLTLGATERLAVSALGGNTRYSTNSTWPHPSFNGAHSPVRREISADGFSADWEVHGLARNLPDIWVYEDRPRALSGQQMGVSFYQPVTTYTIIDRGIKYGLLFIALTFLTFLCFELSGGTKFHVVQYAVVSLGLIMFYMTLLATSEHLDFSLSYVLATTLIVGLLGAYTWGMTASGRRQKLVTTTLVGVLLGLYGTLFVVLQLEDYALLMGTTLLLIGLAALMYATRNLHAHLPALNAS